METETVEMCNVCGSANISAVDPARALNICKVCGFVFDSPRPTIEELVEFYSLPSQYDAWIDDEDVRAKLWQRRVKKLLRHSTGGSLLDIGSGTGQFLHLARPYFDSVTGTEVSASGIKLAKERYGLDLIQGQVEDLDFARTFNIVTMFHVLEHVPDPSRTIAHCARLLQPGGCLFIAVPNEVESMRTLVKGRLARVGFERYAFEGPAPIPRITLDGSLNEIHLSHFTPSSLGFLLERHRLEVVESGLDPYSVARGAQGLIDVVFRAVAEVVNQVTGRNVYDAIWIVARKGRDSAAHGKS